jgi:hypothetical protein
MLEAGVFDEDERIELLEGAIVEISAKNLLQVVANEEAADLFRSRLRKRAVVRSQNPIVLNDLSETEPDIVLAKPPK